MIDEKQKRIYLGPGRANKILTYDLKGNYLSDEAIHFKEIVHKPCIWMDHDKKHVTVMGLPFSEATGTPILKLVTMCAGCKIGRVISCIGFL